MKRNIFHKTNCSFNLTVGLSKMYIFLLLNVLSILMNKYISRTNFKHHAGYFWNFPIQHIIQNIWKKQVQLQVFQCQFNRGAYPIVQISPSKLPMLFHAYSLIKQTFGTKMATSGKFHSTYNSKRLKKRISFIDLSVSV